MTRTFACLAAALALLSFTGCGDPAEFGRRGCGEHRPAQAAAAVAGRSKCKDNAAAAGAERASGDRSSRGKSTTGRTKHDRPVGNRISGCGTNDRQSRDHSSIGDRPGDSTSKWRRLAAKPLRRQLGGKDADAEWFGQFAEHRALQRPRADRPLRRRILRVNRFKIRFAVNYVFIQGEPNPTNSYTVVVRERGNVGGDSQHSDVKFEGKNLRHSGKFEGEVNIGGRSPSFDLHVIEGSSREGNGHQISDVVEAAVRRDLGRPSGNAAPDDAPPAADPSTAAPVPAAAPPASAPSNGGGGLLESLFGNKPTEKAPPPSNTPAAPNNGSNNAPINPQNNPPGSGAGNVPADNANEIALSGVTVGRNQGGQVHFLAAYVFTRGQPVASNWYTVVVQEKAGRRPATPAGEMKIDGSKLQQRGDLEGNVTMGGKGKDFEVRIMEGTSRDDKGRLISNVGLGEIHHVVNGQDIGHPEERAAPGVGAQGKDYGPGLVTTPISAYFAAKQLIVFTIQIPNAMKFFKASNNRDPSSQDEFMEKIIKDNGITLPDLPAGERYIYDPQAGELMVEHPKK